MAKGKPNYAARQVGTAGVTGLVGGGLARVATDLNPESVTRMVPKSVLNPDTGSSVMSHVMETVAPHAPAAADILQNAVETGSLTGLTAAGSVAAYHGIKHLMNKTQFSKHL